jgi:SAM-dependent methyltransferase
VGLRGSLVRAAQVRGQPGVVPGGAVPQRLRARLLQRELPRGWPAGRFDLIVFSEFLYYFGDHDLERVLKKAVAALKPEGTLLAVHWRHLVADYPRSGDDVHQVLADHPGLGRLVHHTEADFLAEVYIRTDGTPVSVAQATGLV